MPTGTSNQLSLSISVIQTLTCVLVSLCILLQQGAFCQDHHYHHHQNAPQPSYTFPTSLQRNQPKQSPSNRRLAQGASQHNEIYINPNPSTTSAGFRPASGVGGAGGNQQQPAAKANSPYYSNSNSTSRGSSQQPSQTSNSPLSTANQSSNIGRGEQSQLVEWPFFKSLQSARKNFQENNAPKSDSNNLPRRGPEAAATARSLQDQPKQQQHQQRQHKPNGDGSRWMAGLASDQAANPMDGGEKSKGSELASGLLFESSTTTTTTTIDDSTSAKMLIETTTNESQVSTSAPETTTLVASETTTTTTSLPPSVVSTTTPTPTTTNDPLFLPEFHKSIQKAVNRLVKMTAESISSKQSTTNSANGGGSGGGGGGAGAGNRLNPRSSLSLNVLLKNFGVHNLTNLDQILLKSTLKNDSHGRVGQVDKQKAKQSKRKEDGEIKAEAASGDLEKSLSPPTAETTTSRDPKIEINGVLMDTSKNALMTMGDINDNGGGEMAECKIEYTMKHVNITLMNGAGSDYSCDYIIDRKLSQASKNGSNLGHLMDGGKKVCKLQLTSSFFSNHDSGQESQEANGGCNGTYLAIGERRFCYLRNGNKEGQFTTLDRVFDFPIERDDFDIKMVHKRQGRNTAADDDDDDDERTGKSDESNEIHLEIKPLSDENCPPQTSTRSSISDVEYLVENLSEKNTMFPPLSSTQTTSTTSTTTTIKPSTGSNVIFPSNLPARDSGHQIASSAASVAPAAQNNPTDPAQANPGRRQATGNGGGLVAPARRKFIIKQPQDKLLHPLNNRFKQASQTFDQPATRTGGPQLCDGMQHDAAMGQLLTPEYPQHYRANMSCLFIIRRASPLFCQLVLHFRDFDLINDNNDCREDYLRIGTTRYCNKYAMIGHKMRLDFSSASPSPPSNGGDNSTHKLELEFRSDHMRSGRGFLIKYHQVPCEQQQPQPQQHIVAADEGEKRKSVGQMGDRHPVGPKQRTIAPPLQQPDFGLALRTKTPPTRRPDGQKSTEPTVFNHNSIEQKPAANKTQDSSSSSSSSSGEVTGTTVSSVMIPMASSVSTNSLALGQGSQVDLQQQQQQPIATRGEGPGLDCNQVHSGMGFTLMSPNFPNLYDNGLQCLFYVRRNSTRVCYLELTFVKFDLEADADCRYDYLEINGVRLCGSIKDLAHKTTRIYMFNEPLKAIKFNSDHSGAKSGFLIRADQLECGSNGSIMRQAKSGAWGTDPPVQRPPLNGAAVPARPDALPSAPLPQPEVKSELQRSTVFQANHSVTRTFEYDSNTLSKPGPAARQRGAHQVAAHLHGDHHLVTSSDPLQGKSQQHSAAGGGCDELLVGREATIRSPLWPESYANDDSISQCRYTILRETSVGSAKNMKICQLELRFVNLRLGVSDCIDVDGYEVLCGFNTRNMVKYYPFDRQSHLTINFFTGASKLAVARSLLQTSDLLPARGPLRFMIIAKQHECIDDFLAPQADLATSYNQTNLLYSGGGTTLNGNRTSSTTQTSTPGPTTRPPGTRKTDALLRYDFSSSILTQPTSPKPSPASSRPTSSAGGSAGAADHLSKPVLMYSLINPQTATQRQSSQPDESQPEVGRCLVQFGQYNGILSSYSVISKLRLSTGPHQIFNECQIKLKLLPGFCKLQLTFGEFDLNPRIKNRCIGEWMELDGVQYCGDELNNSSRTMAPATNEIGQRAIVIRFAGSISSLAQFRAIFKQIECQPEPLRPLTQPQTPATTVDQAPSGAPMANTTSPNDAPPSQLQQQPEVLFKEIVSRSEFFELNSAKLAKSRNSYDANMFIVYRIKKSSPDVCRLRLMFYRFDLEPSPFCKRDFLDVNNVDRLCGQLSKPEDTRRDYEWPTDDQKDFLVSFVSDSLNQREGYLIFGQQIHSNCKGSNQQMAPQMPTFDEDQPMSRSTTTTAAPITTTSTTTTTTTQAPSTSAVEPTSGDHVPSPAPRGEPASSSADSSSCYKLFYEQRFDISSPNWPQRYKPGMTCHYLIHRSEADICSVTFNVVSMILGPDEMEPNSSCDTSSKDHLELGGQVLCGLLSRPQALTVEYDRSQFITAKFSSIQATGFGFFIEAKQNKCPTKSQTPAEATTGAERPAVLVDSSSSRDGDATKNTMQMSSNPPEPPETDGHQDQGCNRLLTHELDSIESERFPQNYKHNQDCLYALRRQNQSICAIDLVLNHFDLEDRSNGSATCDSDYLEIDYSRFCGFYPARHKLRFNYFQDELDKFVRFRSDSALSKSGFSITVHQVSDCHQAQVAATQPAQPTDLTNDEIISYLPDVASYSTANLTSQVVASANSTSSPGKRLGFTNSMAQQQQLDVRGNQEPSTLCQFVYHKERQYLLSPNYDEHNGRTYDNNLDCLYKIVAKSYDFCSLRLTVIDFDLEPSDDCHNDYLLIDNQRYCGSNLSSSSSSNKTQSSNYKSQLANPPARQMEIQFSENLPREIHLLFHTGAHHTTASEPSRGFKLLYEQQACNLDDTGGGGGSQNFRLSDGSSLQPPHQTTNNADRETRRQLFGQLSYPRDYVSSSGSSQRHASSSNNDNMDHNHNHRAQPSADRVDMRASTSWQQHPPAASHGTMDLDEQHDDLTLRKEIVVAKSAPIVTIS